MTTLEPGRLTHGSPSPTRQHVRSALPAVTAVAALLAAVVGAGVPLGDALRYLSYVVVVLLWPGAVVWRVAYRQRREGVLRTALSVDLEDVACGVATGYGLELLSFVAGRFVGVPQASWIVPVLVAACLTAWILRERQASRPSRPVGLPQATVWVMAAVLAYEALYFARRIFSTHPLDADRITDPDEMFHLALVGELRHHFPATYPYLEYPGHLTYQWFVHAHVAAATWTTGLEAEVLYRRFEPLTLTAVATLGTALVAFRVSRLSSAAALGAVILAVLGSFDVTGTAVGEAAAEDRFLHGLMLMHSPTQAFAYALTVPVLVMAVDLLSEPATWRPPWWIWGLATFTVTGAKVVFLPLVVCGLVSASVVAAFRGDPRWRRGVVAVLLVVLVVLVTSWLIYGADPQSLTWAPLQTVEFYMARLGTEGGGLVGEVFFAIALLVMWTVPGVGIVALLASRDHRWDTRFWLLVGGASAGYGATFLLGHGGNSQLFFGRAAVPLLSAASAWGMSVALSRSDRGQRRTMAVAAFAAGVGLLGVRAVTEGLRTMSPTDEGLVDSPLLRVWVNLPALLMILTLLLGAALIIRDLTGGRRRFSLAVMLAFLLGLGLARPFALVLDHGEPEGRPYKYAVYGDDGRAAATWLRARSSPQERVMTNAHCGPVRRNAEIPCDGRHFWMSALSERRFVLEGWAYTARSNPNWSKPYWGEDDLKADNDELLAAPSTQLVDFADEHDVGWILLDLREAHDLQGLEALRGVELVWRRGEYAVLRVRSQAGSA